MEYSASTSTAGVNALSSLCMMATDMCASSASWPIGLGPELFLQRLPGATVSELDMPLAFAGTHWQPAGARTCRRARKRDRL